MQNIKEIQIENFQSHKSSSLELAAGLNIITGPSDTGKSAIIRALRWVLYNEPLGDDFIRVGAQRCRVALLFENGYRLIRERKHNNKENNYLLIDPQGNKEVYTGFGTKVPEQVKELHQMPKVVLDDDTTTTLNLDYQLAGPFLLSDTGSAKAKAVGQLTGVHVVDAAIKEVARDLSRTKGQRKQELSEIQKIDERLEAYQDLPQLKQQINSKEELLVKLKDCSSQLEEYNSLQQKLKELRSEEEKLEELLSSLVDLDKLEAIYQELINKQSKLTKLKSLQRDWQQTKQGLEDLEKLLIKLKDLAQVEEHCQRLVELADFKESLTDLKQRLLSVEAAQEKNKQILERSKDLKRVEKLLTENFPQSKAEYKQLQSCYEQLRQLEEKMQNNQKLLQKLPEPKQGEELIAKLTEQQQKLVQLSNLQEKYQRNQNSLEQGRQWIEEVEAEIRAKLAEYKEKLRELNKCPVCFSSIKESTLESIIANYSWGGLEDE
ncbi:AAA family ATPase [Fuchsiella alkaliacetigena]|uniref:AAA family ATPase n=1 Tax=Fuchsiella alkaliacetigena TaxID=957042 RepID=UPI00200AE415|nr:AAA family ATPase [Fuchsiella alkaliacetigena]MCK8824260.1 AAA family ATPase [Fuchsiella alkaliacetigena]